MADSRKGNRILVGCRVNIGGGGERPGWINLNPCDGSGPQSDIPNHVRGRMEEMDRIFGVGSVQEIFSSKLEYVQVNWDEAAQAAANVMQYGGKVEMNVWCQEHELAPLKNAFVKAGFKGVKISGQDGDQEAQPRVPFASGPFREITPPRGRGVGTILEAIR